MARIVWWEIETRDPEAFMRFHAELSGWTFEAAFAGTETALARVVALGGAVERPRVELGGDDRWFGTYSDPTGVSFGMWTENPVRS